MYFELFNKSTEMRRSPSDITLSYCKIDNTEYTNNLDYIMSLFLYKDDCF